MSGDWSDVVIWFYKPREKKVMLWIDILDFLGLENRFLEEGRKSAREEEYREVASHIIEFF